MKFSFENLKLTSIGSLAVCEQFKLTPIRKVIALSFLITLLFLFVIYLFYQRPPFVVINAKTEILTYQVARKGLAAFAVERAKITRYPAACRDVINDDKTFTGLISPSEKTKVTYRQVDDFVVVQLEANQVVGTLIGASQLNCTLGSALQVSFRRGRGAEINAADLPIAGPAEIGVEVGERLAKSDNGRREINRLQEGELQILARSSLFGGRGSLYPAQSEKLPIPAGSRLTTYEAQEEVDAWYGVAALGNEMLEVSATTESRQLRLYRPGSSQDFETFHPTLFATLFNDPKIAFFSFFFITLSIVSQVLTAWFSFQSNRSDSGEISK